MPNTFNVVDWMSMEGLRLLKNRLVVAQFANTSYNKEFQKEYPIGDTVRVPLPQRFRTREGLGYSAQALNRIFTTVTVDRVFGIDFEWDSVEKALRMGRTQEEIKTDYLDPAFAQIAQDIDSAFALYAYQHTNNIVGILGTDPTTFDATSAAARQRMIEMACPPGEKGMILSPSVMRSVKNAAIGYFNPASDISRQYREGSIGRADGFDWYESMSLYSHTAGTWAGAVTVNGANQSGTSLVLTATTGDTFKKGDVISIANVLPVNPMTRRVTTPGTAKQFVIQADVTAAASAATISILPAIFGPTSVYQNVDSLPANAAALTLFPGTTSPNGKSGKQGLAIHKDAFAIVGVKLETPKAVELSSQTRDPETGISVRFVRAWDQYQSKMTNRFDVCLGFGTLHAESCSVRVLGV